MRKLPNIIEQEFGKDTFYLYRKMEVIELKICDYKNHWRFYLRCLSKGVILVSLKLKNNIRTYRSDHIIYQAERWLLNERIRNIKNIIEHHKHEKCMHDINLKTILGPVMFIHCENCINTGKEVRHLKVLQWQVSKFERLVRRYSSSERSGHSRQDHSGRYIYGYSNPYQYHQDLTSNK